MDRDSGYAKDIDEEMIPNEPTLSRLEKSIGRLCSLCDIQAHGGLQVLYFALRRLVAVAKAKPDDTPSMYSKIHVTYMYVHKHELEALNVSIELGLVLNRV
jgi:hypothetical protein